MRSLTTNLAVLSALCLLVTGVTAVPQAVAQDDSQPTQCTDGADNDGDGLTDLDDPGCEGRASNNDESRRTTECQDNEDNDRDGLWDMNDPGCQSPTDNKENDGTSQCQDRQDNDGDGLTDMDDPGCDNREDLDESDATTQCQDEVDNDGDGLTDLDDPGCNGLRTNNEESRATSECQDGRDNDGDGFTDLNDPGCETAQDNKEGDQTSACQDGIDNDGDNLVDTKDPGCSDRKDNSEQNPVGALCDNGIDDDGDGFIDSEDAGCTEAKDNSEQLDTQCDNGIDDDGDGLIDLNDPGCIAIQDTSETNATGSVCDNGIDDDDDGFTDAKDPECDDPYDNDERSGTACDNGRDDDNDGLTDYPQDPHCSSKDDPDEARYENASNDHNVRIELKDSKDPVQAGETFTYTVQVINLEDEDIVKASTTLTLDPKLEYVSASHSGLEEEDNLIRWHNIPIPRRSSVALTATVRAKESIRRSTTLMSEAKGSPKESETTDVESLRDKDINLSVADNFDPAAPGSTVTYQITLTNKEDSDAMTDVLAFLDRGMTFTSASDQADDDEELVRWEDIRVSKNSTKTLTLSVQLAEDFPAGIDEVELEVIAGEEEVTETTAVSETAVPTTTVAAAAPVGTVTGTTTNGTTVPNTADTLNQFAQAAVNQIATPGATSLTAQKTPDRQEVQPGSTFAYTITLTNPTQTPVQNIVVSERITNGSVTIEDAGNGNVGANAVSWTLPVLTANSTETLRYRLRVGSHMQQGESVSTLLSVSATGLTAPITRTGQVRVITNLPQTGGAGFASAVANTNAHILRYNVSTPASHSYLLQVLAITSAGAMLWLVRRARGMLK